MSANSHSGADLMVNRDKPGTRGKPHLPEKICLACGRPFAWRKKWRDCWEEVKTCSERCKGELRRERRAQKSVSA